MCVCVCVCVCVCQNFVLLLGWRVGVGGLFRFLLLLLFGWLVFVFVLFFLYVELQRVTRMMRGGYSAAANSKQSEPGAERIACTSTLLVDTLDDDRASLPWQSKQLASVIMSMQVL